MLLKLQETLQCESYRVILEIIVDKFYLRVLQLLSEGELSSSVGKLLSLT